MARKGPFDGDPQFEQLRQIREDEGYDGWLDQDNNKVSDADVKNGKWS